MLDLPFNKWTLKFYSPDYERQFEEHANNVKALCFRSINGFASLVGFACLIIFLVQQKSVYLDVLAASVLGVCFLFSLLLFQGCSYLSVKNIQTTVSEKLKPMMNLIFSSLHIAGTSIYIIVNLSGIEIPYGILGYSLGCSTMGIIQYSDNRLKIIYIVATPCILLGVLNIYQINYLHFVFYAFTSMIFTGVLAYMNEYTARLAFALNIITHKQKDIINEFVQDSMFAISFDDKKNSFKLEFQNNKFQNEFDIRETDQMKVFLRSSFFVFKGSQSIKTRSEFIQQKKQQSLEEYLYECHQRKNKSTGEETEFLPEINYLTFDPQKQQIYKKLSIQLKTIDYGKPLMLLIVKSSITPQNNFDQQRMQLIYKQSMIKLSQQLAAKQTYLYKAISKLQVNFAEQINLQQILCLNLQLINLIRNKIIYFSKDKLSSILGKKNKETLFSEYMNTIGQYFFNLANQYNRKFKIANLTNADLVVKQNTQFLSQVMMNIFELVLQDSTHSEIITLLIKEEDDQNPLKINSIIDNKQNNKSTSENKVISFTFYHFSNKELEKRQTYQQQFDETIKDKTIPFLQSVSNSLLGFLGPYNNSYQKQQLNQNSGSDYVNKIIFFIYQDSSIVEPSYLKQFIYKTDKE